MFWHKSDQPHRPGLLNTQTLPVLTVYVAAIVVAMGMTMQTYRLLSYWRDTAWLAWGSAFVTALFVELAPLAFDTVALEQFGENPRGLNWWWTKGYQAAGGAIAIGVTLYLNQVLSQHMASQWDFTTAAGNWANLVTAVSADIADMLLAPGVALIVRQWKQRQEQNVQAERQEEKQDEREQDALQFERDRILAADEFQREMARTKQADRHEERMARPVQVVRPRSSAERPPNEQPGEAERRARIVAHLNEHGRSHVNELIEQANAGRTTVYADLRALDELGQVVQAGRGWYAPRNGHQGG